MTVKRTDRDGVAILMIDNPPVNALSCRTGVVDGIAGALRACASDAAVVAIVLCGSGRCFSAGADIADFGDDPRSDVAPVRALMALLDDIGKPVVAAMHGMAFGGGLELALACHARVCADSTQLALPEVTLGLLPGAGGTQRLPRLAGPEAALDIMLSGRRMSATEALRLGIIDRVSDGDLLTAATALGREIAGQPAPLPRVRDRSIAGSLDVAAARSAAAKRRGLGDAPRLIVECVEAALGLPFDEGLAFEHGAFDRLMVSEAARGLRHAFLAERKAPSVPGLPVPRPAGRWSTAAVVGAGTMGTGIATVLLEAGFRVSLVDSSAEALSRASATVERAIGLAVEKGRCTAAEAAARSERLRCVADLDAAAGADLFIEAAFEDLEVKRRIFERIDRIAGPDAMLATNTSTLDVDRIADATGRPESVIGLHFFSPAPVMKLLEVIRGPRTAPQVVADALALARRIGKTGVVSGVCDGFIGNRIFEEYLRQAYFLLEEGALPAQIDGAMERWGFAMGPLRVMDLAGQDIGWNIRKRRAVEQPDRPYSRIPDLLCERGRFGQKTGAGYYLYPPGSRRGEPDPEIDAMIVQHSATLGIARRDIADEEIVERCLFAMVNEGARILEEGIAARPLDIDVVYLNGYGFPRFRGGPMFHADRLGLPTVLDRIGTFARGYQGWAWEPSPLLARLAGDGAGFATLNG
ncbi:3-hydroxyacyl-CoA dehydrogenase [Azospirillum sp. RWY-5-1]|uniref:3-hydroxyacyl-CoA dehydrogenase n=1 Tax=Azospirillum oleiclasticum TaxID=2735135 RepID=A0ABX2T9Q1_9PROT|nr:3-hydroxyacyl-CoA dehydrogenase [Azospirillum oleiclasticum]NYZ21056.1 3-hydroxyacyl-CoA dehydrogenase [Azospirillum oleiclasticum]